MNTVQGSVCVRFVIATIAIGLRFSSFPDTCASTPESASYEKRLSRIQSEIEILRQKNEEIENEVETLRGRIKAQKDSTEPEAAVGVADQVIETEEVSPQFHVGYNEGFYLASDDQQSKWLLQGYLKTRFIGFASESPLNDEFTFKRARLETDLDILNYYYLSLMAEYIDTPRLKDWYLDIRYTPEARLRLGQFMVPFTWEAIQSHKYADFPDLSIAVLNMLFGGRDIGAMLHGWLFDNKMRYRLAVTNGTGENRADDNDAKDLAARFTFLPFRSMENSCLSKLHLGISGTFGKENADFSTIAFKTVGGTEFVRFEQGDVLRGTRTRLGMEFIWLYGPASVKSEAMWMWLDDLQNPPSAGNFSFNSWYIAGTYVLTGEEEKVEWVSPRHPFNPFRGTWGAWELAARYAVFRSEDDLFESGLATGTTEAEAFTFGINWYLNDFVRLMLDYEHTEFDNNIVFKGKSVDNEDVLIAQWELDF